MPSSYLRRRLCVCFHAGLRWWFTFALSRSHSLVPSYPLFRPTVAPFHLVVVVSSPLVLIRTSPRHCRAVGGPSVCRRVVVSVVSSFSYFRLISMITWILLFLLLPFPLPPSSFLFLSYSSSSSLSLRFFAAVTWQARLAFVLRVAARKRVA